MDANISEIINSIEQSNIVLKAAWKGHAPQVSKKMTEIGKPVGDRFLRYQYGKQTDVTRTNILKRFKQFWAGSYLTRFRSGEIIFADLSYFRSLFLPSEFSEIALAQSFFRVNDLWVEVQKAFFKQDFGRIAGLLLSLTQELFQMRRLLVLRERLINNESRLKSFFKAVFAKFSKR